MRPRSGDGGQVLRRQLYKIEHEAKEFSAEERRALRQERSKPILASLREWMQAERPKVLPKSCKQHGVNTFAYIRDMLVRVSTEPASRIRKLPPERWKAERDAAREVTAAVRDPPA